MSRYAEYFPPSRPREAKGGIKAQSRRGAFVKTWWGRRWLEVLEAFDMGARLARGRGYARKGQVLDLVIDAGKVLAKVQGSRRVPYKVIVALKPIAAKDWKRLGKAVAADAWSAARLIAGEMPETLEDTFKTVGVPLLPAKLNDLTTSCSCPDGSNPCKHIAAVYCLLGEMFDRDPFLLFQLRGLSREGFVAHLAGAQPPARRKEAVAPAASPQPLSTDPLAFWSGQPVDRLLGEDGRNADAMPVVASLGPLPLWRGEEDFLGAVTQAIKQAVPRGLQAWLDIGETSSSS
jgi:uncharacterized Zn finger protein